jgi:hypothetical protein
VGPPLLHENNMAPLRCQSSPALVDFTGKAASLERPERGRPGRAILPSLLSSSPACWARRTLSFSARLRAVQLRHENNAVVGWSQRKSARVGPSLAQLVAAQNQVQQAFRDRSAGQSFTDEHLATIAYALGVLSQERLAAGDRLEPVADT